MGCGGPNTSITLVTFRVGGGGEGGPELLTPISLRNQENRWKR